MTQQRITRLVASVGATLSAVAWPVLALAAPTSSTPSHGRHSRHKAADLDPAVVVLAGSRGRGSSDCSAGFCGHSLLAAALAARIDPGATRAASTSRCRNAGPRGAVP